MNDKYKHRFLAESRVGLGVIPSENQAPLDFESDEPLPVCPMRNNGDDICESCQ